MRPGLVCGLIAAVASSPAFAQDRDLTPADSAALRVATLGVLLDRVAPAAAREKRIWIQVHSARPSMSDEVWQALSDSFPTTRLAETGDTIFVCPEGKQVMMPGYGCPIRDDGVVVELNHLRASGDSAIATGMIVRSEPSQRGGIMTWATGLWLVFEQRGAIWYLRAIRNMATT